MGNVEDRILDLEQDDNFKSTSVTLTDIDTAIVNHLKNVVMPVLKVGGNSKNGFKDKPVEVPVIYGSAERWKSIQRDGFFRDELDQIQAPLVVIKRTSVERNDDMASRHNRHVSYPAYAKYSRKRKYDLFSKMLKQQLPTSIYNVTIPDYVIVQYECIMWADYTEHLNQMVEQIEWAVDEYWGVPDGYKFNVEADSFDTTSEVSDGNKRVVKATCTLTVQGYLLPARYNNKPTTTQVLRPNRIVWDLDTNIIKIDDMSTTLYQIRKGPFTPNKLEVGEPFLNTTRESVFFGLNYKTGDKLELVNLNRSNDGKLIISKEIYGDRFIKPGGTSDQFLKADGSVDDSKYITADDVEYIPMSITWSELVQRQLDGKVNVWDRYIITDQEYLKIEIKLQTPRGDSFFDIIDEEGVVKLKQIK